MKTKMINSYEKNRSYKYLAPMGMIYVTIMLITVSLAYKIVSIFNISIVASTLVLPFWLALADIISEVYGYQAIRRFIWTALFCEFLFSCITAGIVHIHGPSFWHHQEEYMYVFSSLPRVFIGSIMGVLVGAFLNAYVLTKWKILWRGKHFWFRSLLSTAFGELIFTAIVISVNYLGIFDLKNLLALGLVSFCFKIIMSLLSTIPISFFVIWLKNSECIDIYDMHTNFNPFKIGEMNA